MPGFATQKLLDSHFLDHGAEFRGAYNNAAEYLSGARDVIKNGIQVSYEYKGETRLGYLRFAGTSKGKEIIYGIKNPGLSKFEFVGTNSKGQITTYHVQRGKSSFWKMLGVDKHNKVITPTEYLNELHHSPTFR